jgi:hypothetical protein
MQSFQSLQLLQRVMTQSFRLGQYYLKYILKTVNFRWKVGHSFIANATCAVKIKKEKLYLKPAAGLHGSRKASQQWRVKVKNIK